MAVTETGNYEKVNEYTSVKITLASPNDIRSWSFGEVKKPETINYRTYRAEKDGLFCERIFGPERDWECFCGKYKGMKHKGIICDRCGVKVTHSRVRRKRMGHINLAAPVVHIWFFKSLPSRLGTLLAMKTADIEKVVYFQEYVVVDPSDTPLKHKQLLTEEEYREAVEKYGAKTFRACMGAEALSLLLQQIDLKTLSIELREVMNTTKSQQKRKDMAKQLKLVEALRDSENEPEWLVLEVIPVIPPDLRPLVLLESGNFATSDLNDLYRRIINRNNRLKKLIELNAPEVIIRNEKRMLQQSVDSLFDNGRCKRPVLGPSNHPLKSLTDMIKGKQGRFRENLLGKRVDYSARSVIVVGPELRLHQCGLPKKVALELYQPFIIRRLKELGFADTIKSARKMLERQDEEIWDILESVIQNHPVLLNRAPTLHRMGIQAFQPTLIEGNAIEIHPLVCRGFNADFDGDQMAVHLPLSVEAQVEATVLMLSTNNIFSPANGSPIITPSQDIVLGLHYLTLMRAENKDEIPRFASKMEALLAYDLKVVRLHENIQVRIEVGRIVRNEDGKEYAVEDNKTIETTVGRLIFNDVLEKGMPFYNLSMSSKEINTVVADCYRLLSREATIRLLDAIKELGFREATRSGLSIGAVDLKVPDSKWKIINKTEDEVAKIQSNYDKGVITEGERYNQVIDAWTHARELVGEEVMKELARDRRVGDIYVNPIYLMAQSGARGSIDQIRQLAGMRGLMAKPSGKIIESPIKANFREGLHVLEYFSSTHGARKGLADTALKTADSGYLTRKLADVAQNLVIRLHDCGTSQGITKRPIYKGDKVEVSLREAIVGRTARDTLANPITDEVIVKENELLTYEKCKKIQELDIYDQIRVRSILTCEAENGVCALCYGMDRSTGQLVEHGLAVGIIAAQSIGEPGTQLTMRTFHIGGVASRATLESSIKAKQRGVVEYLNMQVVVNNKGKSVVVKSTGFLIVKDAKDREIERHSIPPGAQILKLKGEKVKAGTALAQWDPHMIPILAEMSGTARFEDIKKDVTMREEVDARTGVKRRVITEHKGDLHPQIIITDDSGKIEGVYPVPEKANLEVEEGEEITAGTILAKTPREITGTQDITGGLPRVTELFEARKPKDPAVMSEIAGVVELGEKRRGKRTIIVRPEKGDPSEHLVSYGKHVRVHRGDYVIAGEPLVDGPLVPHDILRINGEEAVQDYLVQEVQKVYRSQGVTIGDKHIEAIVSQMMRKVTVENPGDTDLLPYSVIDKFAFRRINQAIVGKKKKPATAAPLLLGITKAALQSDSFISAASFQESTKVLTEAALGGRSDPLVGLKENVMLGRLIPAGTGFCEHRHAEITKKVNTAAEEERDVEDETAEDERQPA